jgi:quercetin dioxygenase-like cupin family protein
MSAKQADATPLIDNDRVRVIEWRFPPGTETGVHVHGMDLVVVPIITGLLTIVDDEGEKENKITHGVPYFRAAGVKHNVVNRTDGEIAFIEIEMK